MEVRYKFGAFDNVVYVTPGDDLTLMLTEHSPNNVSRTQEVTERIKVSMRITHWIMFYIPLIGAMGGIFGGPELLDKIDEIFVNPVRVSEAGSLIYDTLEAFEDPNDDRGLTFTNP